jgi:hypothetical protein
MIDIVEKLIDKTDPITLVALVVGYLALNKSLSLVKKDVDYINKAVNDREAGDVTMSQEVKKIWKLLSELTVKLEKHIVELTYVKKEIDAHRSVDEQAFLQMKDDLANLSCKFPKGRPSKRNSKKDDKDCDL